MTNFGFSKGIFGIDAFGRVDTGEYRQACYDSENFNFTQLGAAVYRTGTEYFGYLPDLEIMISYDDYLLCLRSTKLYHVYHNGQWENVSSGRTITSIVDSTTITTNGSLSIGGIYYTNGSRNTEIMFKVLQSLGSNTYKVDAGDIDQLLSLNALNRFPIPLRTLISRSLLRSHLNDHFVLCHDGVICIDHGAGVNVPTLISFSNGNWGNEGSANFVNGVAYPNHQPTSGCLFNNRLVLTVNNEICFSKVGDWRTFSIPTPSIATSAFKIALFGGGYGGDIIKWAGGVKNNLFLGTSSNTIQVSASNQEPISLINIITRVIADVSSFDEQPIVYKDVMLFINSTRNGIYSIYYNNYTDEILVTLLNNSLYLKDIFSLTFRGNNTDEILYFFATNIFNERKLYQLQIPTSARFSLDFNQASFAKIENRTAGFTKVTAGNNAVYFEQGGLLTKKRNYGVKFAADFNDYRTHLDLSLQSRLLVTSQHNIVFTETHVVITFVQPLTDIADYVGKELLIIDKTTQQKLLHLEVINYKSNNIINCRLIKIISPLLPNVTTDIIVGQDEVLYPYGNICSIIDQNKLVGRALQVVDSFAKPPNPVFEPVVGTEYVGYIALLPPFKEDQFGNIDYYPPISKLLLLVYKSHKPIINKVLIDDVDNMTKNEFLAVKTPLEGIIGNDSITRTSLIEFEVEAITIGDTQCFLIKNTYPLQLRINNLTTQ